MLNNDVLLEYVVIDEDKSWRSKAACLGKDTSLWFPTDKTPFANAKKTCSKCPVKDECLQFALANDIRYGIWGGLTENARSKIRKELEI